MTRFKLLEPHCLATLRGPAQVDRGTEINSADYIGFCATVHMVGLDDAAVQMIQAECRRLRGIADSNIASTERATLPGIGPVQRLPY